MVIELLDGPCAGIIHEVEAGFPLPDRLALREDDGDELHWYKVQPDRRTAKYDPDFSAMFTKPRGVIHSPPELTLLQSLGNFGQSLIDLFDVTCKAAGIHWLLDKIAKYLAMRS